MVLHCFATNSFQPLLFGLSNHHAQRENSFSFAMCGGQRCQKVEELTGHCVSIDEFFRHHRQARGGRFNRNRLFFCAHLLQEELKTMPEGFRPVVPVSDFCEYPQSWPPASLPLLEASGFPILGRQTGKSRRPVKFSFYCYILSA